MYPGFKVPCSISARASWERGDAVSMKWSHDFSFKRGLFLQYDSPYDT